MINSMFPALGKDFYKAGHKPQYPTGTELVYSNMTARSNKHFQWKQVGKGYVILFGVQAFVQEFMIDWWDNFFDMGKEKAVKKYKRRIKNSVGDMDFHHIGELHDLGYLPVLVKSLPEGLKVPIGIPMFTIQNTDKNFGWVTNMLETLISCELWKPITVATIAYEYSLICRGFASKTCDDELHLPFQCHDFSMRGLSGVHDAAVVGSAHLTSFAGTDTPLAIDRLEDYYEANSDTELVGASVPATEHSVMCMGGKKGELETVKRLLTELYPSGIFSAVLDTWDFFKVLTEMLPKLKAEIMARDGKFVVRPDSGDPEAIICGKEYLKVDCGGFHKQYNTMELDEQFRIWKDWVAEDIDDIFCEELDAEDPHDTTTREYEFQGKYYRVTYTPDLNRHDKTYYYVDNMGSTASHCSFKEFTPTAEDKGAIQLLWETFGGTVNSKGYKVLDSHIGLIYGDSITLERANSILAHLERKGFASSNVVFGVGSFTYQYITRDTFGMAIKATYGEVNGVGQDIQKDPATDDGTKKSLCGRIKVYRDADGEIQVKDKCTLEEESEGLLSGIYCDGIIFNMETLSAIRSRILEQ